MCGGRPSSVLRSRALVKSSGALSRQHHRRGRGSCHGGRRSATWWCQGRARQSGTRRYIPGLPGRTGTRDGILGAALQAEPSPGPGRQASQGKTRDLHPTTPPHLRPDPPGDIGLGVSWPPRPEPERLICGSCWSVCLQLPSDPAWRRRPCCSANGSRH